MGRLSILDFIKKGRAVLRWLLFPFLMWFALQHLDGLWNELRSVKLDWFYLLSILGVVFSIFIGQAGVTKTLVKACGASITIQEAVFLNNIGGFWGLVMPFGSVGYKAQQLKTHYKVPLKSYGTLFFVSLLSSLWLNAMLLFLSLVTFPKTTAIYLTMFFSFMGIILGSMYSYWKPFLIKYIKVLQSCLSELNWWQLSRWHGFGLLNYVILYFVCFKALGIDISVYYLAAWVAIQSFIFLAPIVPGNLVVMETLGAVFLADSVNSPELIVLGIALMRLGCLVGLILLAPISFFRNKVATQVECMS